MAISTPGGPKRNTILRGQDPISQPPASGPPVGGIGTPGGPIGDWFRDPRNATGFNPAPIGGVGGRSGVAPAPPPAARPPMAGSLPAGGYGSEFPPNILGTPPAAPTGPQPGGQGLPNRMQPVRPLATNAPQPVRGGGNLANAQADQDAANAANEARYGQMIDINQQGGARQLGDQNTGYGGILAGAAAGAGQRQSFIANAGGALTGQQGQGAAGEQAGYTAAGQRVGEIASGGNAMLQSQIDSERLRAENTRNRLARRESTAINTEQQGVQQAATGANQATQQRIEQERGGLTNTAQQLGQQYQQAVQGYGQGLAGAYGGAAGAESGMVEGLRGREESNQTGRLADTLGFYGGQRDTQRGLVDQYSDAGMRRISDRARQLNAANAQGLVSRGLSSTTIAPTLERGVADWQTTAEGEEQDRMLGRKLGVEQDYTGRAGGAMESGYGRLSDTGMNFAGESLDSGRFGTRGGVGAQEQAGQMGLQGLQRTQGDVMGVGREYGAAGVGATQEAGRTGTDIAQRFAGERIGTERGASSDIYSSDQGYGQMALGEQGAANRQQTQIADQWSQLGLGNLDRNNAEAMQLAQMLFQTGLADQVDSQTRQLILQGQYQQARESLMNQLRTEAIGIRERRTDEGPNATTLAQLYSQPGAAGGAGRLQAQGGYGRLR